jgi:hypothetical protein
LIAKQRVAGCCMDGIGHTEAMSSTIMKSAAGFVDDTKKLLSNYIYIYITTFVLLLKRPACW